MTIQETHQLFKVFTDKVDSQALPDFEPEEIDVFLSEAQERFVKTRYGLNNAYRQGLEMSQKRIDDLSALVKTGYRPVALSEPGVYKTQFADFFSDESLTVPATWQYLHLLRTQLKVKGANVRAHYVSGNFCQIDDLDESLENPFKRPRLSDPLTSVEDSGLVVYTDGTFQVEKARLTVLTLPPATDLATGKGFVLAPHTHREIIQLAVQIALENIESQRQQTNLQNLQNQE